MLPLVLMLVMLGAGAGFATTASGRGALGFRNRPGTPLAEFVAVPT